MADAPYFRHLQWVDLAPDPIADKPSGALGRECQFYIIALLIAGAIAGAVAPKPLWAHYAGAFVGQLGYELLLLRVGPWL